MNFFHSIIKSLREHVPTLSTLKAFSDPKSQFNKLHEAWKASKLLIIPQSAFFNFQEYFVLAATFFQLIYVPFNATFQDPTNDVQPIEVILLIIFLTDIVLNFHTAYYNDQGQLVINQKAAYRHYLKYRFAFDLIGCFPFEYITRVFLPPLTTERVRFIKLVQLYRFRMAMINHEGTSTNSEKYSLTVYIFMIFLCFHFMACFWWMLQVDLKDTYQNTWANTNSMNVNLYNAYQDGLPFLLYIHSIRFTLNAVTMPGYGVLALFSPNTLPETVVAMVYNLFGVFIVAIYLAKYTGFITNIVEAKAAAELRALNMIRFMEKEKLQRSFQIRALHYLQMIWKKTRGHEEQDRFHDLPKCSLTDLQCEACEKYLRMCLIFENASSGFLRLLSVNVERLNLIPAEIVVRKGEYGTSMYIIRNGYAQVVSDDMKWVYAELGPGSTFGEISLFKSSPRIATVVTSSECEFFVVSRHRLFACLEYYPEERVLFLEKAEARFKTLNRINAGLGKNVKELPPSIFQEKETILPELQTNEPKAEGAEQHQGLMSRAKKWRVMKSRIFEK